jgi:hypothetical protein
MHLANLFLICNLEADYQTLIYIQTEIENVIIFLGNQEAREIYCDQQGLKVSEINRQKMMIA